MNLIIVTNKNMHNCIKIYSLLSIQPTHWWPWHPQEKATDAQTPEPMGSHIPTKMEHWKETKYYRCLYIQRNCWNHDILQITVFFSAVILHWTSKRKTNFLYVISRMVLKWKASYHLIVFKNQHLYQH